MVSGLEVFVASWLANAPITFSLSFVQVCISLNACRAYKCLATRRAGQQAPVAHLIQRFEGRGSQAELHQSAATEDEQAQDLEKPCTPPKRESPLRLLTGYLPSNLSTMHRLHTTGQHVLCLNLHWEKKCSITLQCQHLLKRKQVPHMLLQAGRVA